MPAIFPDGHSEVTYWLEVVPTNLADHAAATAVGAELEDSASSQNRSATWLVASVGRAREWVVSAQLSVLDWPVPVPFPKIEHVRVPQVTAKVGVTEPLVLVS